MLFCVFIKGERDGPLHFVDSSKAPTPASRYGGYHSKNYSGAITPLNSYSHPFELMHLESLREKLNRLSHDKGSSLFDVFSNLSMIYISMSFCFVFN